MRIGIIREGKTPPDQRVPLTPKHCKEVLERFPYVELVVQRSEVRRIQGAEYEAAGIEMADDLSDCDVLFGVKDYVPSLMKYVEKYGATLNFFHNLVAIDGAAKHEALARFALEAAEFALVAVATRAAEKSALEAKAAKETETEVGTGEEALSDIDSDEEREFEEFANDWRGLRTRPSSTR